MISLLLSVFHNTKVVDTSFMCHTKVLISTHNKVLWRNKLHVIHHENAPCLLFLITTINVFADTSIQTV